MAPALWYESLKSGKLVRMHQLRMGSMCCESFIESGDGELTQEILARHVWAHHHFVRVDSGSVAGALNLIPEALRRLSCVAVRSEMTKEVFLAASGGMQSSSVVQQFEQCMPLLRIGQEQDDWRACVPIWIGYGAVLVVAEGLGGTEVIDTAAKEQESVSLMGSPVLTTLCQGTGKFFSLSEILGRVSIDVNSNYVWDIYKQGGMLQRFGERDNSNLLPWSRQEFLELLLSTKELDNAT